jgi:hypothetical protein
MAGTELGIGHDPQQHTAYVKSWIKILKDDPKEILNASKDAEKITKLVLTSLILTLTLLPSASKTGLPFSSLLIRSSSNL